MRSFFQKDLRLKAGLVITSTWTPRSNARSRRTADWAFIGSTGRIPLPRGKINFHLVKIMKIPIGIKRACFQTMAGSQRSLWKHLCHFYVCRLANFLSGCSLYNSLKATSRHPLTLEKHWCTQRTLYMALVLNPKSIGAIQKERVTDIKARRQRNVVWLRDNCLTVFYGSSSTWLKRQTTAQLESNASL